jgi:hypothetical protein
MLGVKCKGFEAGSENNSIIVEQPMVSEVKKK